MVEVLKKMMIEELSYSGMLHIRHIRMSPTYRNRVVELLVADGKITIDENGFVRLV